MEFKSIFVTVGTTEFRPLIKFLYSSNFVNALKEIGCRKLIVQAGNFEIQNFDNEIYKKNNIALTIFNYKKSLLEEIANSDLIISHAGAGTCLEGLRLKKKMLVVINENLMDNHQTELAIQLTKKNYLKSCKINYLVDVLKGFKKIELDGFPEQKKNLLENFIEKNIF